jgi:RNA polymerase sigma-70 factor, ECF subfamily
MNEHEGWVSSCQLQLVFASADDAPAGTGGAALARVNGEKDQPVQPFADAARDSHRQAAEDNLEAARQHNRAEAGAEAGNEQALVAAARNGDAVAFGELIERHRKECLKRAMMMIRNRSDAEDEVQNAFCKAFQRLDQFRGEGPFAAWLGRILENQCLMRIREARNSRFVYLDEANEANVRIELVGQTADPEEEVGTEEVIGLLRREVSRIPPLLRNAMLLRDLNQMPMPDVATKLHVSIPAAKSRLMRARLELRSRISKHCGKKGPGTLLQMPRRSSSAYTRAS